MSASIPCRCIVAESDQEFDQGVHEHCMVVEFPDDRSELQYERLDSTLATQVQSLLAELFDRDNDGVLYHQNLDWWPNQTRGVDLDSLCITWRVIERFQSLLVGDFTDWRIIVHVYTHLDGKCSTHLGGLKVYRDWVLVQRDVYECIRRSPVKTENR